MADNASQFCDLLLEDIHDHVTKNSSLQNEETTMQIKNYFESLSDEQKRTIYDELSSGDERKRDEVLRSLWKFDGDLLENTKKFVELVRDHNSLSRVQKKLQDKKDIGDGEKDEREHIAAEKKRVDDVVRRHKELHPPQTRECPVCLDDVEITEHNSMIYMFNRYLNTLNRCGWGYGSTLTLLPPQTDPQIWESLLIS